MVGVLRSPLEAHYLEPTEQSFFETACARGAAHGLFRFPNVFQPRRQFRRELLFDCGCDHARGLQYLMRDLCGGNYDKPAGRKSLSTPHQKPQPLRSA